LKKYGAFWNNINLNIFNFKFFNVFIGNSGGGKNESKFVTLNYPFGWFCKFIFAHTYETVNANTLRKIMKVPLLLICYSVLLLGLSWVRRLLVDKKCSGFSI
jgi:hypothetical protein